MSKQQSLNLVEYIFIACAVAATVVPIITKQGIFEVILPILTIGLILINWQQFDRLKHQQVEQLQQFIQRDRDSQNQKYVSSNQLIKSFSERQDKLQQLTESIPHTQQQIEELKATLAHSNQSIDSLAKRLSQIEKSAVRSPLTSELEALKNQIQQIHKILEYLNNTKAEKENVIEIDSRIQQIKKFQQTVERVSTSVIKEISLSKNNARFLNSDEKLISLLQERNWKEANEETAKILLRLAEKQLDDSLNREDIKKLPVEELKKLDRLWSTYSNGRFSWLVRKLPHTKVLFYC